MTIMPRRLVLWFVLAALAFAPTITGAMLVFHGARYLPYAVFFFSIYSLSFAQSQLFKRIALVILSIFLTLTVCDLAARPLLPYILNLQPAARFVGWWAPQPHLLRYSPEVTFDGGNFGDLATMTLRKDVREERHLRFVTDRFGFRNEPSAVNQPIDLILLGDSFGATGGTSQEELLASFLAKNYGFDIYNVSVSGHSPQQEYATLFLENDRLKKREGTTVLWLLFAGNDLDDLYYKDLENPALLSWPQQIAAAYERFHDDSTVRRLLGRSQLSDLVITKTFLNGRPILFLKPYAERILRNADDVRRHPNFDHFKTTFTLMNQFAKQKNLRVVVAVVPSKEEVYSWVLNGAPAWTASKEPSGFAVVAHELCDANGFKFFDLKPTLIEASEKKFKETGELLWWRDDTHWNGVGQRVAADAIYQNLLRDIPPSRYSLP